MSFYEQISNYYDYIFPTGTQQLEFIKTAAGLPPKSVLDVACGSGGYSVALAKTGYSVTAVDLDEKMIAMTLEKERQEQLGIKALACNMLEISKNFGPGAFDLIFCIGNSIVHLGSKTDILDALKQMRSCLKPGGAVVLQIINFDRVFKHNITSLPTIMNDEIGLEFVRNYSYDDKSGLIKFNTLLTVNGSGNKEEYDNTVELLPLLSSDLKELMDEAGFRDISFYGDFEYSKYDEDSYMLVVKGAA